MKRKIAALWLSSVMLFGFIVIVVEIAPHVKAKTIYVDDDGGVDYTRIQDAIDNASDGDTVYVYSGTYDEDLIVDKVLSLIGEDKKNTIILGNRSKYVIDIVANWVNITGFTVTNGSTGINLRDFSYSYIENNNISSNDWQGIYTYNSNENNIVGNDFSNNYGGIACQLSCGTNILDNTFINNTEGVFCYRCNNTSVIGNDVSNNIYRGIRISTSSDNIISNNHITNNDKGIYLRDSSRITIDNNIMIGNGIFIDQYINSKEYWNTHNIDTSNTVNGKPVYYWKNKVGGTIPAAAGQVILANCTDVRIENQILPNITRSINIGYSSNNDIINCAGETDWLIIYLSFSHENNIIGNRAYIIMYQSDNNSMTGNVAERNWFMGIYLNNCDGNEVINNFARNNMDGIKLYESHGNNIMGNNVSSSSENGIDIHYSNNNHIVGNDVSACGENGIYLEYSDRNDIDDNNASGNYYGIYLFWSMGNNITNNKVFSNEWDGIHLAAAYGGNVTGNEVISNVKSGINSRNSHRNNIDNNILDSNMFGIYIFQSKNNIITDNNISKNSESGITVYYSTSNYLAGNYLTGNSLVVLGDSIEYWDTHDIDTTNMVNGKPLYYWKNQTGGKVPGDAGQVILVNCTDVTVKNLNITQSNLGIGFVFSTNNKIKSNKITSCNKFGIYIYCSNGTSIIETNITGSDYAIYLFSSDYCNISRNRIWDNYNGIKLEYSNDNFITQNIVMSNGFYEILLISSSYNQVYHNDIVPSSYWVAADNDVNYWDNGYPSGGNYWDVYSGVDDYSGPNQDQPGSDGICDRPYTIDIDSQDNYPLMEPFILDLTPPIIELLFPANNSVFKPGTIINLSISDKNLDTVTYSLNGGPDVIFTTPFNIFTDDWLDGNYTLKICAIDYFNHINLAHYNFTVDSIYPLISLVSPQNNSVIKAGIIINFSVIDENLDEVLSSINGGSNEVLSPPYNMNTSTWLDGNYIVTLNARDKVGNFELLWFNLTIDSTPPMITLITPINNSFIKMDFNINLTISDENLNSVTYSKDGGTSQSLPKPFDINTTDWSDGEYIITILANDLAGNYNKKWFFLTKDSIKPEITLNSPDNDTLLLEPSTLYFDIFDKNLKIAYYSINHGSFMILEEPYEIDTIYWGDGDYTVTIKVEDEAGNTIEKWYVFKVDISQPEVISIIPYDGSTEISVDGEIIIQFNEPMDVESVESTISITPFAEFSPSWSNDNKILTANFLEPLAYKTLYQISISTKAKDLAGRNLESDYEFEFTTEEKPEEEGFLLMFILLILLLVIIVAIIIVVLIIAKKKKATIEDVEAEVIEIVEPPRTIQFTCSNCNNLLQVTDTGITQNVTCPYCSTLLTVPSQIVAAPIPQPQLPTQFQSQPQVQTQPQPQQSTIQISCPKCSYRFAVMKTDGLMQVQCPNCGVKGKLG